MRIGIDLGGTKIEALLLDGHQELARVRVQTPQHDYRKILLALHSLIKELEVKAGQSCHVGICGPGSQNAERFQRNSNTVVMNGKPFIDDLQNLTGREIRFSNDANCFTLAEALAGSARNCSTVFGIILGTGCGGGLVVDRKIITGVNGIGGEWGHNALARQTADEQSQHRPCFCGRENCNETFISGTGLSLSYTRLNGKNLDAKSILQLADQGDSDALTCREQYLDQLARALAVVINIFDPECIVAGGGLSNAAILYDEIPRRWGAYVFSDSIVTKFLPPGGGDAAGALGAAWLWPA